MIEQKVREYESLLLDIRHQIHENPEMGLEEVKTSALVAEKLTEWGYQVHRGMAKTGVIGTLTVGDSKKTLGIRADMDALPIQETSGKPWASKVPNRMHACGHDGHTTMLLGAAKYLAESRHFNGTVHLIFQPAEETINGGEIMVKEGLFEQFPCDAIFGMHNMPGFPAGKFIFQSGGFMASMDHIHIVVHGRGGHGAIPNKAIDPVVVASHITTALQSIISRNVDPLEAAVITVGSIVAGEAANVIPDEAVMKLSVRALSRETRELLLKRITEVAQGQAISFGATAEVKHINGTPVLVNNAAMTEFAWQVAKDQFGADNAILGAKPLMGSEDFAFMLDANPNGCYLLVGNGDKGEGSCMVHNPGYDFNDKCLVLGSAYWGALTEAYLK
ncbi:MAG: amidohydrolase [Enterobacteriaceae bacterium]|jgi:hippurate hydrolase|nr:amidohydrolase [Enterobacteriaceae bacterium]